MHQVRDSQAPEIDIEVILEELGWPTVERLIGIARGRVLTIPRNPADLATIGITYASGLCDRFAGRQCLIPSDGALLLEKRDKAIRKDSTDGMERRKLLVKYHMTQRELERALWLIEG